MEEDRSDSAQKRPRETGGDKDFRSYLGWQFGQDMSKIVSYLNLLIDSVEGIQLKLPDDDELFPERVIESLWAEGGTQSIRDCRFRSR